MLTIRHSQFKNYRIKSAFRHTLIRTAKVKSFWHIVAIS